MKKADTINIALSRFHFYSGIGWNLLPPNERKYFEENSEKIILKKGKILFRQGSYPNGVYVLMKGKLKVYQLNFDRTVHILFIYAANEVFGYRPILSNEYQPVSVAAIEDCELIFVERILFLELLQKSLSLSNQLLVSLCHEFTVLTNRLNVFAQRGIKERLALALLILNEKFKKPEDKNGISEIKMSRTDLSNYVGTSLENLVRTITVFKEKGLICSKGKSLFIEDFENLFILSSID